MPLGSRHGVAGGAAAVVAFEGDRGEADEEAVHADSPDRSRAPSCGSLEMSACVPRFSNDAESSEGKRLDEYVAAIRSTIKVFAKYHHRKESLAEYHRYIVWVDGWAQLSGFGRYCVVSETVRVLPRALLCWLVAMAIVEDA